MAGTHSRALDSALVRIFRIRCICLGASTIALACALVAGVLLPSLANAAWTRQRVNSTPAARLASQTVSLGAAGLMGPGVAVPTPKPGAPVPIQSADPTEAVDPTAPADQADPKPVRSTLHKRSGVPPFWINNTYDTHRTRASVPWFIHRDPDKDHPEKFLHVDLALTFGWYSKRLKKRRWVNPAGLFFGSFSERKTVWAALPLLMGYRRVGEQFNFGQFPLVWWWGTKFVKNFLVAPFHYQQRSPDGFNAVSALLFWYGHKDTQDANLENDRRHFVAAPVFWRFQRGLRRFDFAFLYLGGQDKLKGRRYFAVTPLALWHESEFGNRKELWSLGWVHRTDKARRRNAWAVPFALTFSHKDPDKQLLAATPLFWHARNHLKGSRFTLAGPVGVYDDPRQRNMFAAPLWLRFKDKENQAATNIVLPLAITRHSPQRTSVWTPLAGGRRTSDGWAFGVPAALTFAGSRRDGRRFGVVGGALWHVRRPATADKPLRSTWVAGPLGFLRRKGDRSHLGVLGLLSFAGWGGGKHYQALTPVLWHVRDSVKDTRTLVAGPMFHHKTKGGFDGGIAPLAFWGNNQKFRYGVVPGLLSGHVTNVAEQRSLTISPVFVHAKSADSRTLGVLNLGWDVKRPNERHTAVVPLFYRRQRGDQGLIVSLLGGQRRDGDSVTSVYGPFYRQKTPRGQGFGVLPMLFHDRRTVPGPDGHSRTASHTVLFPLFLRRRTPSDDLDIWTPLVWRSDIRGDKPRQGLAVAPFYFRQRQPGGVNIDAGLGFFYSRDARRRTHTLIAGTGFHRLSRKGINAGIVPMWWWIDSAEKRRLLALPAIFHFEDKKAKSHTTVAVPFWFDRKRADGRRGWAAFPFVIGNKRFYNHTRFSLAIPGYFDLFRLERNYRFTGYVPLLFRYEKCGFQANDDARCRYRVWGSFPLFLTGKDGQGRKTHGALAYYFDRTPKGWKLYTPVFGVNNQPGSTLGWYAGPLAVKTTNTHRRVALFPLYYRRAHRLKKQSLTLVVPPLFVARNREDRGFFEAGLLFWQFRKKHKVSTAVVPPIFYYSHSYEQRRLYWVLPLFVRDNHIAKDEAWFAIPGLYTQRRRGKDLDFVVFPLVWHIERGANQGTFGAFAWWDIRTKGKTLQLVPGAFTRWVTAERDTKIIGPGLGWWSKGRGVTADNHGWRALFGAFGAGQEDGRRYLSVFGARVDRGPAAAAKPVKPAKKPSARAARRARRAARRRVQSSRGLAQNVDGQLDAYN